MNPLLELACVWRTTFSLSLLVRMIDNKRQKKQETFDASRVTAMHPFLHHFKKHASKTFSSKLQNTNTNKVIDP